MVRFGASRHLSNSDQQTVDSSSGAHFYVDHFQNMGEVAADSIGSGVGVHRRNKPRRSTPLGIPFLRNCDSASPSSVHAYRLRAKNDASEIDCSPIFSPSNTHRLPPLLSPGDDDSSSSGQSSPQTSYSSGSVFSSRGSSRSSHSSAPSSHGSYSKYASLPPDHSRNHLPRILVSSLLSNTSNLSYFLEVVQHPQKAAEFSDAPLSRLPVTPPVVVRLTIQDGSGNPVVPEAELPFLIAHLSLYSENGLSRVDGGSPLPYGGAAPLLYGNLVSTVDQLEDLQGNRALFFLFPDVSIRWRGRYQLGITLLRISGVGPTGKTGLAQHGQGLAEARTRVFDVLPRHQYTAVPQTRLTQSFLRQGARMFTFVSPSHP